MGEVSESAPLVSTEVDLRDFAYMPLDVIRLRDCDLTLMTTSEEFRAAVILWCAAWHQLPAASLPDDDRILASLAGFGRDVAEWQKHRDGALHHWIKCSDGRLYHPVVAEKANEAWEAKQRQRNKTAAARAARSTNRDNTSSEIVSISVTIPVTDNDTENVIEPVTSSKGRESNREGKKEESRSSSLRSDDSAAIAPPVSRKRKSSPSIAQELPEDWQPDDGDRAYAAANHFPPGLLEKSAEDMRLWAKANKIRKHDWHATLKGFMRRDAEKLRAAQPRGSPSPKRLTEVDYLLAFAEKCDRMNGKPEPEKHGEYRSDESEITLASSEYREGPGH